MSHLCFVYTPRVVRHRHQLECRLNLPRACTTHCAQSTSKAYNNLNNWSCEGPDHHTENRPAVRKLTWWARRIISSILLLVILNLVQFAAHLTSHHICYQRFLFTFTSKRLFLRRKKVISYKRMRLNWSLAFAIQLKRHLMQTVQSYTHVQPEFIRPPTLVRKPPRKDHCIKYTNVLLLQFSVC